MKNHMVDILTILLAGAALLVSIKSCRISENAQQVSERSLKISEGQFTKEHRPYILIEPAKFKEPNEYVNIEKNGDHIKINFKLKMENVGNVTAINISAPDFLGSDVPVSPDKFAYSKPPVISLAPTEKTYIQNSVTLEATNPEGLTTTYQKFTSKSWNGITFHLSMFYFNELDRDIKYQTIITYKITREHYMLLRKEFKSEILTNRVGQTASTSGELRAIF